MQRKTLLRSVLAAWVFAGMACSDAPPSVISPTAVMSDGGALNPDGSNLKVKEPTGLSPNGPTVDSLRPTLTFTASEGLYVTVALEYETEVVAPNGSRVFTRVAPGTSHTVDVDLEYATDYTWRTRPRRGADIGPWSGFAAFRTLNRPPPPGPTLPFPIPAECGPGDPGNRFSCALAIAALSEEWRGCAQGFGTRCHRFTRQVAFALSRSDPNWQMITAAPGGNACNCNACGPSDGSMFREDTVVYGGNRVFDVIIGAGGPTPSLNWSLVPGPRSGDIPADAPLCSP